MPSHGHGHRDRDRDGPVDSESQAGRTPDDHAPVLSPTPIGWVHFRVYPKVLAPIAIRIIPAWGPHIATSRLYAATAISPPARFTCRLRLPVAYDALIIFTILRRQVPFSWSSKPHSSLGRNSLQWPHRDAVLIITIVATSVTRLGPPGSCVAREPGRLSFALRRHHPSLGRRGLRQHRPALPWRRRSESDPTKRMK